MQKLVAKLLVEQELTRAELKDVFEIFKTLMSDYVEDKASGAVQLVHQVNAVTPSLDAACIWDE